jgi:hypothetical protein
MAVGAALHPLALTEAGLLLVLLVVVAVLVVGPPGIAHWV